MRNCILPIVTLLTLLAIIVPGCSDENPLRGAFRTANKSTPAETVGR